MIKQLVRSMTRSSISFFLYYYLGALNKEEFIGAFESILDQNEYKQLLEKLFDKVSRKK
jgi:hypothetical protein